MRALIVTATLALPLQCAGQDLEKLLANPSPQIQQQLEKTYAAFNQIGVDPAGNADVFREALILRTLTNDKTELVRQLVIFVATTESEEYTHVILSHLILRYLGVSPEYIVQVLAPCLESDDRRLHEFARRWFKSHDDADPGEWAAANYKEYMDYVRRQVRNNEEVPAGFVRYIYSRSPGLALRVFQTASRGKNFDAQLQARRNRVAQPIPQPNTSSDIALAEHLISNAIWLNKRGFNDRFQAALPEAMTELEKLAKHKEWWARLYVVYIMRQNPMLVKDNVLRQLAEDSNELVREATKPPPRQ
jgi:hypothetical protein